MSSNKIEFVDTTATERISTVYPPYEDNDYRSTGPNTIPEFINNAGPRDDLRPPRPQPQRRTRSTGTPSGRTPPVPRPQVLQLPLLGPPRGRDPPGHTNAGGSGRVAEVADRWRGASSRTGRCAAPSHSSSTLSSPGRGVRRPKGTVDLPDTTKIDWWLRTEPQGGDRRPRRYLRLHRGAVPRRRSYGQAYAEQEEGDTRIGAAVFRQFGDRQRQRPPADFLIIEPPEYDEPTGCAGVAPSTGRADLYWMGAGLFGPLGEAG